METRVAFAKALKRLRKAKLMSQEEVSTRTYLSQLERGLKSPTLGKIEELAGAMGVQPLTLLLATYEEKNPGVSIENLLAQALAELKELQAPPK